ncbi:class III lanthionine synthetase LanKC N-terminal domain-containing protein [Streptomyces sparsogenes]|uniref:class III lanthionine synthetase LanKC N-terminal domain-containing protein n=1 Tax=Streptomyces sparsogenes TaxID=67365 RepID=UPI000823FC8E|nr:lanthionine synthetase LanC family protein [Streptomyces sparsogenes]
MLTFPLHSVVRSVLAELDAGDWTFEETDTWCHVSPPAHRARIQGWKLHVSATPLSVPHVLHRAAEVLVAAGCAFKFAGSVRLVDEMTSAGCDRAQCGKIITAYPRDDDRFRSLAEELDAATAGLPGPAILSDRPYRKGSLVHYRYGAFLGKPVLTDDGSYEARIEAPDGTLVTDHRKAWFAPPGWAVLPLDGPPGRAAKPPAEPGPVLLADRFEVREAIRHSARGGVYRALDRKTGREVVVKQARAHVGGGLTGEDARALLRREARNLSGLAGVCPELVHEFDQDGHAFLVEGLVDGEPLARWVRTRVVEAPDDGGMAPAEAVEVARDLARLLAEVHRRGLVHQDFTPNNVMVTPERRLVLIDPEWATAPGTWTTRAMTPGFASPEQGAGPRYGPAFGPESDLYSLGAVLCYLATGVAPVFAAGGRAEGPVGERADEPAGGRAGERAGGRAGGPVGRAHGERIRRLLDAVAGERPAARLLAPAVLGLTREDPARRWTVGRVLDFLDGPREPGRSRTPATAAVSATVAAADVARPPGRAEWLRLVDDGLTYVLRGMADPAGGAERLWPAGPFGDKADPCAVQHGAAGVLATLVRADELLDRAGLRDAIARVADWTDARSAEAPRALPGLYFGRSGTAWALYDAARHLGDTGLADRATGLALSVPVSWPNPDVCHGVAGAGLAHLRFWHRTGRAEFLARAVECADRLVAVAETTSRGVWWPVPDDCDSALAGARHLGFAHGVAGVGAFLLYAARETGDRRYTDLATAAGRTLVAEAERGPWGARWRSDAAQPPGTGLLYHWCSGSSGVGTFLLGLALATGDDSFLGAAREAAVAVHRVRWSSPTAACHGLAGDGEFLLDLAEAVPDGPYRRWAEDLAAVLYQRHTVRDGLLLIPDETGSTVRADHQTGLGGPIHFLLRLAHGGPRPWMPLS